MQRAQIVGLALRQLERLQHAQHLQDRDAARRWRRHAADLPHAIGAAERLALHRPVVGEVGQRQGARPDVRAHPRHDLLGYRPFLEGTRALLGQELHRVGQRRIGHAVALLLGAAVLVVIDLAQGGLVAQRLDEVEPAFEARRDDEAVAREADGRSEQVVPGELAALLVRHLEHGDRARHADRNARRHGLAEIERLAVGIEEHRRRRPRRRRLAAVVDRDGGIDRRAATTQHLHTGLDRLRMGRGDHRLRRRLDTTGTEERQRDAEEAISHARRATMKRRRKGKSVMPSARVG